MTQQPVDPYAWQAPGPPPQRPRSRSKAVSIVLVLVAVLAACGAGVAFGSFIAQPQAGTQSAAEAPPGHTMVGGSPSPRSARTQAPTIEDGVWTIGVDFPAGSYRTTANVGSRCYWQISKTGGDSLMDIIDNDLPGGGRPQVTLKKGQTFKTDNCGKWRKV